MPTPVLGAVVVNDLVSFNVFSTLFEQRVMNTFYYECVVAPTVATDRWVEYVNLWNAINGMTGWFSDYRACFTNVATVDFVRLQTIKPQRLLFRQISNGNAGAFDGASYSANIAASIERRANVGGRQGIGRTQIYGVPTSEADAGEWSTGYMTALASLALGLKAQMDTSTGAVWYPVLTGVNRSTGVRHISEIVDAVPQRTVRVMRRRTVRVGE